MFSPDPRQTNSFIDGQLSPKVFELISGEYLERFGYTLIYADTDGNLVYGLPACQEFPCQESCRLARQQSIDIVVNYGLPLPTQCPSSFLFWALPVSLNNQILGGLIAGRACQKINPETTQQRLGMLTDAQKGLVEIAERYNVVNHAFLQHRRTINHVPPSLKGESIATQNSHFRDSWRSLGKKLIGAIESGDRSGSFRVLDEILEMLRQSGSQAISEAKGFSLELFASTLESTKKDHYNRKTYFRFHYETAEKIVCSQTIEEVCACIHENLERFLESIHTSNPWEKNPVVEKVFNYIENHIDESLNREKVAKAIGMSSSRLSHILKEETNQSYSEIVKRYRMSRASQLLITTNHSVSTIAMNCGFCDQSHFTKVFQKFFRISPVEYRRNRMTI